MSDLRFTEEQSEAIEAKGCDLLISAAAGSGKTAVLAERIVRLVSEGAHPCDIDRILVVTFTRAAAAGMRERIAAALSERIGSTPENAHLRRQEVLLPHAKIMTIDAFCQYVLRNNFDAAGLDPSFRVGDEGEMKLLAAQALEEVLEECYAAAERGELPDFLYCAEYFATGATDRALEEEILKLARFAESLPWPTLWLKKQRDEAGIRPDGKLEELPWITDVTEMVRKELDSAVQELEDALRIVRSPGGPWMYEEIITDDIEKISAVLSCERFSQMHDILYTAGGIAFGRLPVKRDESVLPVKREAVRKTRDAVKTLLKKTAERYFSCDIKELSDREEQAGRAVRELVRLVLLFREKLEEKKRAKNMIDFSDMEHLALRVLAKEPTSADGADKPVPTATARDYAAYFQEIMIDEYQDSNFVQELLLGAIAQASPSCRRFMVGDVKQSIYRFRLARPEIFMEKYGRYGKAAGLTERRIDLHLNFRSRSEVLTLTNEVFARMMRADVGGVEYDEDAKLRAGAVYPVPGEEERFVPELLLFVRDGQDVSEAVTDEAQEAAAPEQDAEEPDEAALSAEQAEARMIAERIRHLISEGEVSDGQGGFRRVRYGDIVILLRAASGVDEVYRDILTECGIPVHIESKTGYFQAREVRVLTDLLAVIENPLRDIALAGVLRSVIGEFTDEELACIRAGDERRGGSFYEALVRYAGTEEGKISHDIFSEALQKKCSGFLQRLSAWREAATRLCVRELLEEILEETDYMEKITAMPAGAKRRANVQLLLVRAADFEKTGGHGLTAFTARIEQYRLVEVDFGEAGALAENADLVRVMSIHKSKGLEYPVVFVAGLSRVFNRRDERSAVLADERIGIGAYAVDSERRVRHSSLKRLVIADKLHEESIGEEYRVLYVAMTRAKEKLILTAGVKREQAEALLGARAEGEAAPALSYLKRAHAKNFADALFSALAGCGAPLLIRTTESGDLQCARRGEETAELRRRQALTETDNGNNIDSYLKGKIEENLTFSYAHEALAQMFVKTTVTELKERLLTEEGERFGVNELYRSTEEAAIVPRFLRGEEKLVGAARGTAYHKVMELLDSEILDLEDIVNRDLIKKNQDIVYKWMKKRENNCLPTGYADVVAPGDVLAFLCSDLGQRFVRAFRRGALFREKQFMMSIDAKRVDPGNPEGEMVLLQGVIDAYFIEDGKLVLLDYKTDRVSGNGEELAQKYGVQLALYAEALTRITGLFSKERWIWSFAAGRAIPVADVTVSP